jgi:hypothetical protein
MDVMVMGERIKRTTRQTSAAKVKHDTGPANPGDQGTLALRMSPVPDRHPTR